jgi:pyruvate-formate lyase
MRYPDAFSVGGVTPVALADPGSTKQERLAELSRIVSGITAMDPHSAKPLADFVRDDFDVCRRITQAFRDNLESSPEARELAVLKAIFPARLDPIRDDDLFAGRARDGVIGHSSEIHGGYVGFYVLQESLSRMIDSGRLDADREPEARAMLAFWRDHATHNRSWRAAWREVQRFRERVGDDEWEELPEHWTKSELGNPETMWFLGHTTDRVAGLFIDGRKLVTLGLPGLIAEARELRDRNTDRATRPYYDATIDALEYFRDTIIPHYVEQADAMSRTDLAGVLRAIRERAPQTLREAIQLAWLYLVVTRVLNVGRIDEWFGTFYVADLDAGRLTEDDAQAMVDSLWRLMNDEGHNFNSRVLLGGADRIDVPAADAFALLCLETTRRHHGTRPQTTLRCHTGMNQAVYDAALRAIGEGCTFPMLLNDDVNVAAVTRAFGVPSEDAAKYLPLGCGEFVLDHTGICSPNSAFSSLKCLEYALHDGRDALTGHQMGPHTGTAASFTSFDDLWHAYERQIGFFMDIIARKHAVGLSVVSRESPFLFVSALTDDCLVRGKPLLSGARYVDGSTEVNSFVNTGDSLTAIRRLVWEERRCTLPELVAAMDDNWVGHDELRSAAAAAPKFGNDEPTADAMAVRVHDHVAREALTHSGELGVLRKFLIVHVNNHAHVQFGGVMAASADGRRAHATLANANNPSPGCDRSGTTAMLKSLAKITPDVHAGVVQNMKFSRQMFTRHLAKTKGLLGTYFALGGTQAMITVVSSDDLKEAMEHPELHQNLVVRVGGYSARFVDLSRDLQLEILERTLNE